MESFLAALSDVDSEENDQAEDVPSDLHCPLNSQGCASFGQSLINSILERKFVEAECLIKNGAEVNFEVNNCGWTPLMYAASLGTKEAVELLLKHGADPNYHVESTTPLMCLCDSTNFHENQLLECLNMLINAGANVNVIDNDNFTPLIIATKRGHKILIHRLLELGTNLEAATVDGWTAIFFAVNSGDIEVVKMLMKAGSNLFHVDENGQSLYDLASLNKFDEITNLISDKSHICFNQRQVSHILTNYLFVKSEMPNSRISDYNGFHEDTLTTLVWGGLTNLIPLFSEKKIGFGKLLILTEDDLKKIGVEFSYDRRKLCWCIYKILQRSWSRHTIIDLNDDELNLFWLAQIMSNNIRIIHILKASLHVCMREITCNNMLTNQSINFLNECLSNINLLCISLLNLNFALEKIAIKDNNVSVDYIGPQVNCTIKTFFNVSILLVFKLTCVILRPFSWIMSNMKMFLKIHKFRR